MRMLTKVTAVSVLTLLGAIASTPALADYGHRHGHGHGGVRFGISFGVPVYGPRFYPAPYYPYPAPYYAYPPVVVETAPPVYIEQPAAPSAPAPAQIQSQAQGDWYYCPSSKAYYPYVNECQTGWQRVPAQPPAQ